MKVTLRQADASDSRKLFSICRRAYTENFANHWNEGGLEWYLNEVYSLDGITLDLTKETILYFVASIGDEDAGFMKLNTFSNLPGHPDSEGAEIEKLYFLPQHQGKGIGKMLVNLAIERSKSLQKKVLWLGVIDSNHAAIEFYTKAGFQFHSKTTLEIPFFKTELKGMWRMSIDL